MSDQPGMSHDELIEALRRDMAATSAERDAEATKAKTEAADRDAEQQRRAIAEGEIAKLKAEAAAAADPDAQIRAGIAAIKRKFADLF